MNKYPRLRSHIRRRKDGRVRVYWFYDMRPEGEKDLPLGSDYDEAIKRWDEIHNRKPRIAGTLQEAFDRFKRDVLPGMSAGNRKNYTAHLRALEPVFGPATWDMVGRPELRQYYDARSKKGLAAKEIKAVSFVWNHALEWGLTRLPNPAQGMRLKGYGAREMDVTDELFAAVYAEAEQPLRDCMDLITATGMRLGDALKLGLAAVVGEALHFKAGKTGKRAEFQISESQVLPGLIERRKALRQAVHVLLLSDTDGQMLTPAKLRTMWERARERAAVKAATAGQPETAAQIRGLYLRDMRKRAANLAGDIDEAAKLLQHSSKRLTETHYRTRADRLKPVR